MFQITPTTHLADDEEEEVKEKQKQGKTRALDLKVGFRIVVIR